MYTGGIDRKVVVERSSSLTTATPTVAVTCERSTPRLVDANHHIEPLPTLPLKCFRDWACGRRRKEAVGGRVGTSREKGCQAHHGADVRGRMYHVAMKANTYTSDQRTCRRLGLATWCASCPKARHPGVILVGTVDFKCT